MYSLACINLSGRALPSRLPSSQYPVLKVPGDVLPRCAALGAEPLEAACSYYAPAPPGARTIFASTVSPQIGRGARASGGAGRGGGVRGPRRAPPSSSPASDAASRRPEPLQEGQTSRNRVFRSEKHPRPTRDHGPVKARFSPHKIKKKQARFRTCLISYGGA